jgi:DnaD/phage-associated family protein
MKFKGFSSGKVSFTSIPTLFFSELLPIIDNLPELKVTLYAFWFMTRTEEDFPFLRENDLLEDDRFLEGMGTSSRERKQAVREGLENAVERGTLLGVEAPGRGEKEFLYFINSPRGRAAVKAILDGSWKTGAGASPKPGLSIERPNIFELYEDNIGPLTPMIADSLKDAEKTYSSGWIEEAFQIAVENNVRRWKYIEAILRRWKEEGRHERKDRRHPERDGESYLEDEFSEFLEQ